MSAILKSDVRGGSKLSFKGKTYAFTKAGECRVSDEEEARAVAAAHNDVRFTVAPTPAASKKSPRKSSKKHSGAESKGSKAAGGSEE